MSPLGPRYREKFVTGPVAPVFLGTTQTFYGAANINGQPVGQAYTLPVDGYSGSPQPASSVYERCTDEVHQGPPYLTGGNFAKYKAIVPSSEVLGVGTYETDKAQAFYNVYKGGWGVPDFFYDDLSPGDYAGLGTNLSNPSLFPPLDSLGAGAYARLRPQVEKAGLGIAIAEARDLPRMMSTSARGFHDIWKSIGGSATSALMQPKRVADHFLNLQFGWIPFLKDLHQFYDVFTHSEDYMRQLSRDNNRWVKRKRVDKVIESETEIILPQSFRCQPVGPWGDLYTSEPSAKLIIRFNTHVWYEGVFKYYRPEFDGYREGEKTSTLGDLRRLSTLYGARINPSVVWKATPWTWLIDWFTNVGDTIQRATDWAFDGVVSKYMYLMHHHVRTATLQQRLPLKHGLQVLEWNRVCDIKQRRGATSPYGFSLSVDDLSGRQLAILGALGISRTF